MSGEFPTWLQPAWDFFEKSGPLANFLQIGGALLAGGGIAYGWMRRRISDKETELESLRNERDDRDRRLHAKAAEARQLQELCDRLKQRLADTALAKAEREWREGNDEPANHALRDWLEQEGKPISRLLQFQAEWAASRAVGDLRPAGLSAAEGFAAGALSLWPENSEAIDLANDMANFRMLEAQERLPFPSALAVLRDRDADLLHFQAELVEQALAEAAEAAGHLGRGLYHLAMPLIERAVMLLRQQLSPNALQTLRARRLRARLLYKRGYYSDALKEIEGVAAAAETSPELGPENIETLYSRHWLATLLDACGRSAEALPIIEKVAAAQAENSALGLNHPHTQASRTLHAAVLRKLGRT
jgi:tetratricopeptide (TPR) repeat protein